METKIDRMAECLKRYEGTSYQPQGAFKKYFDLIYSHPGTADEKFMFGRELRDVINEEIRLCGYFVIITSEKMSAQEALDLYKGRDASEKLFRGDKSYLGNRSFRAQTNESVEAKIFIEFVALIIRNRFHTYLKNCIIQTGKKQNYMNVPAAIRELEKIEIVKQPDHNYRLANAVTATQKTILNAFGMTAANVREQALSINDDLVRAGRRNM